MSARSSFQRKCNSLAKPRTNASAQRLRSTAQSRVRVLLLERLEDRRMLSAVTDSLEALRKCVSVHWDSQESDIITIDLTCHDYALESIEGYGDRLTASGLITGGGVGEPELPRQIVRVALPPDTDLSSIVLSIDAAKLIVLPGQYDLGPGPEAGTHSETGEWMSASPDIQLVDGRDPAVYSTNVDLDPLYCEVLSAQQLGRYKIVELAYSPFDYNPVTGAISVVAHGKLTVTFHTDDLLPPALRFSKLWDATAAELLVNPQAISEMYDQVAMGDGDSGLDGGTANYVIITTANIAAGSTQLDTFVAVKELLGHTVEVVTETEWGGGTGDVAAANIRTWLRANYAAMGIEYVLLVGNPHPDTGDVPMKMTWPRSASGEGRESPTDLYYAELTSNWDVDSDGLFGEWGDDFNSFPLQEVLVGRIPVYNDNMAELDAILLKTIGYTTELEGDWRKSMILPMAVISYRNENGADGPPRVGDAWGERIVSDIAVPKGYDAFTLYEKEGLTPVTTASDAALTKNGFLSEWTINPPGIVGWMGHGSPVGAYRKIWSADSDNNGWPDCVEMSSPSFITSRDLNRLDDSHPAIVIQGSCNNGFPEVADNLGYSLLKEGAIATVSASRVTWELFYYGSTYTFNTSWGDLPSQVYSIIRELVSNPQSVSIGRAMKQARLSFVPPFRMDMLWMNWTDLNLYGDPSVKLGTVLPASIEGVVFEDTNLDGTRQAGEPAVTGAIAYLDMNNNGWSDPAEPFCAADADGQFAFPTLRAGTYQVRLVAPEGLAQYSPAWGTAHQVALSPGDAFEGVSFGLGPGSTISGHVWHDLDGSAVWDTLEPGINEWTVYVDTNGNGQLDAGEIAVATHDDLQGHPGYYVLTNVAAGPRTIAQTHHEFWDQTFPAAPSGHFLHVIEGQDTTGVDFGNQSWFGSISGYVWNDLDGNATWDPTELGLNGWVVYLDANTNGQLDADETWVTTHDDLQGQPGFYEFAGLPAGTYMVAQVQQPTWTTTSPLDPGHNVLTLAAAEDASGWNFGKIADPATIAGHVWYDLDVNGLWDVGEPGLNGWRVYIDRNDNGQLDAGERVAVSRNGGQGDPGHYEISHVPAGTYSIAVVPEGGWIPTTPTGSGVYSISVGPSESVSDFDFGRALNEGTILVSTLADDVDGDLRYGALSLREALATAQSSDTHLIVFDPALAGDTITLGAAGALRIGSDVTILGVPDDPTTAEVDERISISGACASGVMAILSGIAAEINSLIVTDGAAADGAGLRIESDADLTLIDMEITGNRATAHGGGIYNAGTLIITNSVITGNAADGGGGIHNTSGTLTITNSTVSGNSADVGGAMNIHSGTLALTNSIVSANTADDGGGIYSDAGTLIVTNSTVTGNASSSGGGIYHSSGTSIVTGSMIASNAAVSNGGGIYHDSGTLIVTNSTIAGNAAISSYGGICSSHALTLVNSIVALNAAPANPDFSSPLAAGSAYNLIGVDPGFVRNPGPGGDGQWGTTDDDPGDLHLTESSPAVDMGHNDAVPEGLATDLDGNARITGGGVDIGAYEFQDTVLMGREDPSVVVTTLEDKFDLYDGEISLREALFYVEPDVLGGTITFAPTLDGGTILLNGQTLNIEQSANIDASALSSLTIAADGRCRVLTVLSMQQVELVALTITGGQAVSGGGIYSFGTLTITNATISGNAAANGGGVYGSGTLIIANSTISGNSAEWGGGVCNAAGANISITDSLIIDNTATERGGGLRAGGGATVTIVNTTLSGNRATQMGGAIAAGSGSSVTMIGTSLIDNQAGTVNQSGYGGAIAATDANTTVKIQGGEVTANTATSYGGGLYVYSGAAVTITRANVYGNSVSGSSQYVGVGGGIAASGSSVTIINSSITNNRAGIVNGGWGGGVSVKGTGTAVAIHGSIISNNTSTRCGGVYVYAGAILSISGATIAGNTATDTSYGYGVHSLDSSVTLDNTIVASHGGRSDIRGTFNSTSSNNLIGIRGSSTTGISNGVNGNLVGTATSPIDPKFVAPLSGNYRLLPTSPARDRGNNSRIPPDLDDLDSDGNTSEPIPCDLDGNPRVAKGAVDIGAYEYQAIVRERHVFYNNSSFDGNNAAANAADDIAIATDKQALRAGEKATFANYTSYSRGINGIMIDISHLARPDELSVADFEFRTGNNDSPAGWPLLALNPAQITVAVRPGEGVDGSDRVTIIFPDGAIKKTWLQVTVKATDVTGLAAPDVHYWGNAIGDSGNSPTDTAVNVVDALGVRANPHTLLNPAPINDAYDYNRDKQVNVQDELIVRANPTTFLTDLNLIDLTGAEGAEGEAGGGRPEAGGDGVDGCWLSVVGGAEEGSRESAVGSRSSGLLPLTSLTLNPSVFQHAALPPATSLDRNAQRLLSSAAPVDLFVGEDVSEDGLFAPWFAGSAEDAHVDKFISRPLSSRDRVSGMAWSAGTFDGQCPIGPVNKEQSHAVLDRTHLTPDPHGRNSQRTLDEALLELLADWEQW